jgi:hypothetical protein
MELICRLNRLLLNGNAYIPSCSRDSMENRKIAMFLVFIFLASTTHLDYFSENEKLELEMKDEIDVQSSSSNPNHDVGNFSRGGYHLATGEWWEPNLIDIQSNDFDGDGLENSMDEYPLQSKLKHLNSGISSHHIDVFPYNLEADVISPVDGMVLFEGGDVDGDGDLDLIGFDDGNARITVFGNEGLDPFQTIMWDSTTTINLSNSNSVSIEVADYDHDGDVDILLSRSGTVNAMILQNTMNSVGQVNFSSIVLQSHFGQARWGDFNNDGHLDLGSSDGNISVNQGNGSYPSSPIFSLGSGSFVWHDFNHDGMVDFLRLGAVYTELSLGDSTPLPIFQSSDFNENDSFSVHDFDRNGEIDLLFGCKVYYSYSNYSYFQKSELYSTWSGATKIIDSGCAVIDYNYDSYLDIVVPMELGSAEVGHPNNNLIFENDGGSFNNSVIRAFDEEVWTHSVTVLDIDNNGIDDIIFANKAIDGFGTNEIRYGKRVTHDNQVDQVSNLPQSTMTSGKHEVLDIDFDGASEIIVMESTITKLYDVSTASVIKEFDSSYSVKTANLFESDTPFLVFALQSGGIMFYDTVAESRWPPEEAYSNLSIQETYQKMWLVDMNNDGYIDVAAYNSNGLDIYHSNETVISNTPNTISSIIVQEIGDINNDGFPDLITSSDVHLSFNGTYLSNATWNLNGCAAQSYYVATQVSDVNNDEYNDVVIACEEGATQLYLYNTTSSSLNSSPDWISYNTPFTSDIETVDINNDGHIDLIVANAGPTEFPDFNEIFFGNGNTFSELPDWRSASISPYSNACCIITGNFDESPGIDFAFAVSGQFNFYFSSPDLDGDGISDEEDELVSDPTQKSDMDNDGYGDRIEGYLADDCPIIPGTSWRDRTGCSDLDNDGQSDLNDRFFNIPSQWLDSDGDGLGDNWDSMGPHETRPTHWPGQYIQNAYNPDPYPFDFDNDGFEDESIEGAQGPFDACPFSYGTSSTDRSGCQDSDGDGRSDRTADWTNEDGADMFPTDITQWIDSDGDGFGDNPFPANNPDACPSEYGTSLKDGYGCLDEDNDGWGLTDDCPNSAGNSTIDQIGCPDRDGDGYSDDGDSSPDEPDIWSNIDGDAYFDQGPEETRDDCPSEAGTSFRDRLGCVDPDGDGWSSPGGNMLAHPFGDADSHPTDATQWRDRDGDGYGDNQTGNSPDSCPDLNGPSKWTVVDGQKVPHFGCADSDFDGFTNEIDTCPNVAGASEGANWGCPDSDNDGTQDSEDSCPSLSGTSTANLKACPDSDGDGIADLEDPQPLVALLGISTPEDWDGDGVNNDDDEYPFEQTQWEDLDGDGFGDNSTGVNGDPSPGDYDNDFWLDPSDLSTTELGCLNNPEKGMDYFPEDPREWKDNDGDCIGDNSDPDDDNDGYSDVEEAQQGTDPLSSSSKPIEGFEIIIPGTEISLGAWDLIGIFGGVPLFAWIGFGIVTRNSRTARFEEDLKAANSREELEEIAKRWEFALMIKLIGPHQGIRLERMRAEYDDRFENQAFDNGPITTEDQTLLVEISAKEIPAIENAHMYTDAPSKETPATSVGTDGYEWFKSESGIAYFRTEGSQADWTRFD